MGRYKSGVALSFLVGKGGAFFVPYVAKNIDIINRAKKIIETRGVSESRLDVMMDATVSAFFNDDIETALYGCKLGKSFIECHVLEKFHCDIWGIEKKCIKLGQQFSLLNTYYDFLKIESFYNFESFIFYLERKRKLKKRFYQPRKCTLHIVVEDLQEFEDSNSLKFYGLSMPSRVGKSTICIFFLLWVLLKRPNSHNAMVGHSGILAEGFYKEILDVIGNEEEYTFGELYRFFHPNTILIRDKSNEKFTITLDSPDRFASFVARGIDGSWTGTVDISSDGYLYVDDLVRDRQHALSVQRMNDTYAEYLNKCEDRKNDGAKTLMVGTLWNVLDPLERTRKMYEGNPAYRFRKIPALDENEESNFAYEINGFSTKYYLEMREKLDPADWASKFMQAPYVREGLIFPHEELNFFNGILPPGDYRRVAVVDIAWGGGDNLSMPIGAEYSNGDVYIYDWIYSNGAKEITLPLVAGAIILNEIRAIRFEGNQGGDLYCQYIEEMLLKENYKCSCTSKKAPNNTEKMAKIVAYSGDIKRKFYFITPQKITHEELKKDKELGIVRYIRSVAYNNAMEELEGMSMIKSGSHKEHDDSGDSLAQLVMFLEKPNTLATVEAVHNPYRY